MTAIQERISALDDFQVVRFFEHFGQQIFAASNISLDTIKAGIPDTARQVTGFTQILDLPPPQAERPLEPSESAALARNTLLHLAEDETFAVVIERSLESFRDDAMVADVVLAVGFVASIILIAATTEFEGEIAGIKFRKSIANPKIIRAITEPFAKVLAGMGRGD